MSLTAYPFNRTTGELLPGYRDAYLRGDLSSTNTELVDNYLKANPEQGTATYHRFHTMQATGHQVRPVGWLQQQFDLLRTQPARFRRRAGSFVLVGALLSGAVFASTHRPNRLANLAPVAEGLKVTPSSVEASSSVEANSALKMKVIKGRILDENGHPLVGATILHKGSGRGVGTDAQGNYALAVPASQPASLQFGYGGYTEEEARVSGGTTYNVTLLPRTDLPKAKRHWWSF
jgi:hypothetical protein